MRSNTLEVTLTNPEQDKLFRQLVSAVESLGTKVDRLTQALSDPESRQQLSNVLRHKFNDELNTQIFTVVKNGCCQEEKK